MLKDSLTTAKNMAYQAQLALKTKTQTKANMYHYLLLTSLSPLNGSGLLSLKMVLFVQVWKENELHIQNELLKKSKENANNPMGGTEFVSVDEYLTSQICNKCKSRQLNNISITGSKRRVYSVLKCESCSTVWNHDVNSALNIYGIFVYKSKHDNESPPSLQKTFKRLTVLPGFNALSITAVHSLTPR